MYMVQNFKSNTLVFVNSSFSYKPDIFKVYLSTLFEFNTFVRIIFYLSLSISIYLSNYLSNLPIYIYLSLKYHYFKNRERFYQFTVDFQPSRALPSLTNS